MAEQIDIMEIEHDQDFAQIGDRTADAVDGLRPGRPSDI